MQDQQAERDRPIVLQTGTWTALNLLILIGLFLVGGIGAVRGGLRVLVPRSANPVSAGRPVLPAIGLLLSLSGLAIGRSAGLPIPVGYAGGDGGLSLDPISCVFSVLAFVIAGFAEATQVRSRVASGWQDLAVAAVLLALLAGDAFLLACGAILAMLALGMCSGGRTSRVHAVAGAGVAGACALLSQFAAPAGALLADPGFAVLRGGAGSAWDGTGAGLLLPVLSVLAVVPLLGLWPAQALFRRHCAFAPVWVPALGSLLGLFLLIRLLLDLAGPVPSAGWGVGLVLLGVGSALLAGLTGLSQRRPGAAIGCVIALQNGLAVAAMGFCLLAKADDLPLLAGAAFDCVLLFLPVLSLAGVAALSLARIMEHEAGSALVMRLGGLVQSMPRACLVMTVPFGLLGCLSPAGGFVGVWLLLQCALSVELPSIAGLPLLTGLLVTSIAVSAALGAAGLIRLAWVVALGRPRTPRGAAATDIGLPVLRWHGGLLALSVLAGLVPGLWLRSGDGSGGGPIGPDGLMHPLLWLLSPGGTAMLFPLPILLAIGLAVFLVAVIVRRFALRDERRDAAWEGGASPPPPWLPFGDPATQIAPASLAIALHQAIGLRWSIGVSVGHMAIPRRYKAALTGLRAASDRTGRLLLAHGDVLATASMALVLVAAAFGALASSWVRQ